MDLDLSESQSLLRSTFSEFFTKESPPDRVRAAEPLGFDQALWDQLVSVEATTMGLPEGVGGGGASAMDLVLVAQEVGKHAAPIPYVESAVAGNLLASCGADDCVAAAVDGAIPTLALRRPVDGRCRLVPAGAVADVVVILDGEELVALHRTAAGERPYASSPPNLPSSPVADVKLDDPAFERILLASGSEAERSYEKALTEWKLLMAAALDGLRSAALAIAVNYVKHRKAFGVPIGWFQAIQHRLADITVAGDGAEMLVYRAAWARDVGEERADNLASIAYLFLSELAFKTCRESLQFHGGYGFTLEYDIQLYFRRAKAWPLALGDPRREYERLAARLFPEASVQELQAERN
jgi:alkylation response protein AidB-like acyl-CoA dehydrogenase